MCSARQRYPANKYPFSDELCLFMDKHQDFLQSLKIERSDRFHFLQPLAVISLPHNHPSHGDQILGFFFLDKSDCQCGFHKRICRFKQDFVVKLGTPDSTFISYTHTDCPSNYVRPTEEFFNRYGKGGQFFHNGYEWEHHYEDASDLPDYMDPISGQSLRKNATESLKI